MTTEKMTAQGKKAEEGEDPRASAAGASPPRPAEQQQKQQLPQAPPLPRTAHGETLAEASGIPSVVRFALWSLENAAAADREDEDGKPPSPLPSSSSLPSPPPSLPSPSPSSLPRLLPLLPATKQALLRLAAVSHAALLEVGRCWPEGQGGEEEEEEEGKKKPAFARALSLPRPFLSAAVARSSSSSSSCLPLLSYSTLRGAAGRAEKTPPPPASLRVTFLGGEWALVTAGISRAAAAPSAAAASSLPPPSPSFPAAFSVAVNLSEHFDAASGELRDPGKLWRALCDGVASPLAAAAAASRGLPQLEASLLGLPHDLLLEVLLIVARAYELRGEDPKEEEEARQRRALDKHLIHVDLLGRRAARLLREASDRVAGGGSGQRRKPPPVALPTNLEEYLPRKSRHELDLMNVALSCMALRDFILGGGGGDTAAAAPGPAAAPPPTSSSSSLLWETLAPEVPGEPCLPMLHLSGLGEPRPPVRHLSGLGYLTEIEAMAWKEAFCVAEVSALMDTALQQPRGGGGGGAGTTGYGEALLRELRRMKMRAAAEERR